VPKSSHVRSSEVQNPHSTRTSLRPQLPLPAPAFGSNAHTAEDTAAIRRTGRHGGLVAITTALVDYNDFSVARCVDLSIPWFF
jgi:hypothetical protein